jgi:hypothetical protein
LTTLEFFQSVRRVLKPEGRMIFNFIGIPSGVGSASFRAIGTTMTAAFEDVRASAPIGNTIQNIVFVASRSIMSDLDYGPAPTDGYLLSDDLNPIEVFLERARGGEIYYRR